MEVRGRGGGAHHLRYHKSQLPRQTGGVHNYSGSQGDSGKVWRRERKSRMVSEESHLLYVGDATGGAKDVEAAKQVS